MNGSEASEAIDARAADFVIRADAGPLSPDEQAELDRWIAEDARHLGAYTRALAIFAHARRAKALGPHFDPDNLPGENTAAGAGPAVLADRQRPNRRTLLRYGGMAAAVVAAVGTAVLWPQWPWTETAYRTDYGQVKTVQLDDGSSLMLNTATELVVNMARDQRNVKLVQGEAFFEIAPDPDRPFVVSAGDARARVVGTRFNVLHLSGEPVEVLVEEGKVEISGTTSAAFLPVLAHPNTKVVISPHDELAVQTLTKAELNRNLTWRDGMLSFENTPLRDAARAFRRYSRLQLEFADTDIAEEPVTGYFSSTNPLAFAQTVAGIMDLDLERVDDRIILSKR